jgi:hypothetical protein
MRVGWFGKTLISCTHSKNAASRPVDFPTLGSIMQTNLAAPFFFGSRYCMSKDVEILFRNRQSPPTFFYILVTTCNQQ